MIENSYVSKIMDRRSVEGAITLFGLRNVQLASMQTLAFYTKGVIM